MNADNAFASLLYNATNLFMAPFASLVGSPAAGGVVLDASTIIAMIVYLLVGWDLEWIVILDDRASELRDSYAARRCYPIFQQHFPGTG